MWPSPFLTPILTISAAPRKLTCEPTCAPPCGTWTASALPTRAEAAASSFPWGGRATEVQVGAQAAPYLWPLARQQVENSEGLITCRWRWCAQIVAVSTEVHHGTECRAA